MLVWPLWLLLLLIAAVVVAGVMAGLLLTHWDWSRGRRGRNGMLDLIRGRL